MLKLLCWTGLYAALVAVPGAHLRVRLADDRQAQASIAILRGDAPGALPESPGKWVTIRVQGATARLHEGGTGLPVGSQLYHDPSTIQVNPPAELRITCWAFSPDGQLVATGAGYKRVIDGEVQENEGEVRVWEVPSGRLLATERRGLGRVSRVAFRSDSKAVLVEAEPFEIDGE